MPVSKTLSLNAQEVLARIVRIRDGSQLGSRDGERTEGEVIQIPPISSAEGCDSGKEDHPGNQKISIRPPDLPGDEIVPHAGAPLSRRRMKVRKRRGAGCSRSFPE